MAVAYYGGSIFCRNCDYNPTDITVSNNLAYAGGFIFLSYLSDNTIILDSFKSDSTYSYLNAGVIYLVTNAALDF